MQVLHRHRQRMALRSYIAKVPGCLRHDYGFSRSYTEVQIRQSLARHGLSQRFADDAVALFVRDWPGPDDPRATQTEDFDLIKVDRINDHFGHSHEVFSPVDGSFGSSDDPGGGSGL